MKQTGTYASTAISTGSREQEQPAPAAAQQVSHHNAKGKSGDILSAWTLFILNSESAGMITLLLLLGVSIGLCFWMKKKYDYRNRMDLYRVNSVTLGYLVVLISMVLTIFQIAAIFSVRDGASDMDIIYALMVISTGIPMATIPWRIRISSLVSIRDRSYSDRYAWGGRIGVIGWIILLFPLCVFYLQSASTQNLNMGDDSFGGMLLTLGIFFLIAWLFVRFFWPFVIVKYFFKSMNSTVLGILNIILAWGIGLYGYKMCDQTFTGLTYVVSLWALLLIMMVILMAPINLINEKRCGNCHNFDGQYNGSTDLGSTYKTNEKWESTGTSNISPRHSDAIISDARRKVRTTTRVDKWKTHHSCPYCNEEWDLDHEYSTEVGSETLERRWKETY